MHMLIQEISKIVHVNGYLVSNYNAYKVIAYKDIGLGELHEINCDRSITEW